MIDVDTLLSDDIRVRLGGSPLVVMLDVDGTLAPIAQRPEDAVVPPDTRRVVAALAAQPNVHVALVTGRAARDARRMVSVANLWVIGNHGCEIATPDGEVSLDPLVAQYGSQIVQASRCIASMVEHVPGLQLEDKGPTLSVHYRRADPGVVPRLRDSIKATATEYGLRLTEGKMVLDLRPPVMIDKGTAILTVARSLGALSDDASLFFAGDDETDEEAFRLLRSRVPRAVTVRVSADPALPTAAQSTVRDTDDIRAVLEWLLTLPRELPR
jgi:trehalose-phosphatase